MNRINDAIKILHIMDFLSNDDEPNIDELNIDYYTDLKAEFSKLDKKTLWNFWYSWSLGKIPSRGILFLKEADLLDVYPELFNAIGVMQNPETHPEGDVFTHMMYSVDYAAYLSEREELTDDERSIMVFSSLCHDMGKEIQSSYQSHEKLGVDLADSFLRSIGAPKKFISIIKKLVRYHGIDEEYFRGRIVSEPDVIYLVKLLKPATFKQLYLLNECDLGGRGVERSFDEKVSDIYKEISMKYLSYDQFRLIDYEDMVNLSAENDALYIILCSRLAEEFLRKTLNTIRSSGYLTTDEILHFTNFAFTTTYNESLSFVSLLDYRQSSILSEHLEKTNISIDELLNNGVDYIKEVLNHSAD